MTQPHPHNSGNDLATPSVTDDPANTGPIAEPSDRERVPRTFSHQAATRLSLRDALPHNHLRPTARGPNLEPIDPADKVLREPDMATEPQPRP